ncbi:MAG: hypothetical protein HYX28_09555 [Candidatus Koribacter versatilis]|uniref:Uncharacterized protein n=1 Tax=Candidatus Korobacter versatilis TaxID=658062 RepID=A0A932AB57_9BACT|nr:hypothetical protein [Candidatus Koribacter versatilis]
MRLVHKCPKCGSFNTMAVPPLSAEETVYHMVLLRRYACLACNWPFREFAGKVRLVRRPAPERRQSIPGRRPSGD